MHQSNDHHIPTRPWLRGDIVGHPAIPEPMCVVHVSPDGLLIGCCRESSGKKLLGDFPTYELWLICPASPEIGALWADWVEGNPLVLS